MLLQKNFIDIDLLFKKIETLKEFLYKVEFDQKTTLFKNIYNETILSINFDSEKLYKNTIKIYDNNKKERIVISSIKNNESKKIDNVNIYLSDRNGRFVVHQSYHHQSINSSKKPLTSNYFLLKENIKNTKYTHNHENNNFLSKLLKFSLNNFNIKHFLLNMDEFIEEQKKIYHPFYKILLGLKNGLDIFKENSIQNIGSFNKIFETKDYLLKLSLYNKLSTSRNTILQYVFYNKKNIQTLFILELYGDSKSIIKFKSLNINKKDIIKIDKDGNITSLSNYNFNFINNLLAELNNKDSVIYKKDIDEKEKEINIKNFDWNVSDVVNISNLFQHNTIFYNDTIDWNFYNKNIDKEKLDKIKIANF